MGSGSKVLNGRSRPVTNRGRVRVQVVWLCNGQIHPGQLYIGVPSSRAHARWSPMAKAINSMLPEGAWYTIILKPTMATHPVLTSSDHNHSNYNSSIANVWRHTSWASYIAGMRMYTSNNEDSTYSWFLVSTDHLQQFPDWMLAFVACFFFVRQANLYGPLQSSSCTLGAWVAEMGNIRLTGLCTIVLQCVVEIQIVLSDF
jgi:hypothetical protein